MDALTVEDCTETRQSIIDACHWMYDRGLIQGTSGNVSLRIADGLLVTPSGVPYDILQPEMLQIIPHQNEPPSNGMLKPTSEWRFHQSVLAARFDMVAVVHAHPPHATAVAVQRRAIPACHYMIAAFGGNDVPLVEYALFGSASLAQATAAAMEARTGCLLANHGAVTAGETLARALWRMEELEMLARVLLLAEASGAAAILTEDEIGEAIQAFASYGPKVAQ